MALLLVGDTGQLDPEIYAAAARAYPGRVPAIYVRRTGILDARRRAEVDALAAEVTAAGVPMLAVDDSVQIAEHAAALGLLDAGQVDDVAPETHTRARAAAPRGPAPAPRRAVRDTPAETERRADGHAAPRYRNVPQYCIGAASSADHSTVAIRFGCSEAGEPKGTT